MTYNRFIQGLNLAGVEVDRKILADLAVNDPAAFTALVETAKAALPEDVNAPTGRRPEPSTATPLTAGNARVKEARKLSRRSVRSERRLFLADGPNAVEGASSVPELRGRGLRDPRRDRAVRRAGRGRRRLWTLVDDRALASLSDSVTPAGVVAVCRFLDVPLEPSSTPPAWSRSAPTCATPATPAP